MIPDYIDPGILKLFPYVKTGVVESGLWGIPLYFDKSFGRKEAASHCGVIYQASTHS
ncbi:MAG: hypothetical protein SCH70_09815 [Candidatus Methanoperedens sp.]|nr:hypothetical protein [Candidatus Methanoperedens sp.]